MNCDCDRDWREAPRPKPTTTTAPAAIKYALYYDPLGEGEPIPGSGFNEVIDLGDGLRAFKTADGHYLSQNPNARGSFALATEVKAYETFGLSGSVVTSWTRPAERDRIFSYVLVRLPNAA